MARGEFGDIKLNSGSNQSGFSYVLTPGESSQEWGLIEDEKGGVGKKKTKLTGDLALRGGVAIEIYKNAR